MQKKRDLIRWLNVLLTPLSLACIMKMLKEQQACVQAVRLCPECTLNGDYKGFQDAVFAVARL